MWRFTVFSIFVLFGTIKPGIAEESLGLTNVCINDCTGHGKCTNFECECFIGYFGDDCRLSFAANSKLNPSIDDNENELIPILGAGHYNLTTKNFSRIIEKNSLILVGFSSPKCHKCIMHEREYKIASNELKDMGIPFARANADKFRGTLKELNSLELPALVVYRKGKAYPYQWHHSSKMIVSYIKKQIAPAIIPLKTVKDVITFAENNEEEDTLDIIYHVAKGSVYVIGFFSDFKSMEEDEYSEFIEAVMPLQTRFDVIVGVVTDPVVVNAFKGRHHRHHSKNGDDNNDDNYDWIDRSPSLVIHRNGIRKQLLLDEFYGGDEGSVSDWVLRESLPLVDMLTNKNFPIYEKLSYPMLLLFLDYTSSHAIDSLGHIGGESGGVSNDDILEEFRNAASEHTGRVAFLYLDGTKHVDQMRTLGLFGGKERLPAVAFNTKDGRQMTFSEKLPINRDTLLQFVADFLSGKLKSKADAEALAQKALTNPRLNMKNLITDRKPKKKKPKQRQGVSEQFNDDTDRNYILPLNLDNFETIAMDETKDVLILFHEQTCEPCANMAVYYKRMAERFHELGFAVPNIPSLSNQNPEARLVISRFDLTNDLPPPLLGFHFQTLPALVILPSRDKALPYRFFSGVAKVLEMMKWVQSECQFFELPPLAHLRNDEIDEYKRQVAEREAYRLDQIKETEEKEAKYAATIKERKAQQIKEKDEL